MLSEFSLRAWVIGLLRSPRRSRLVAPAVLFALLWAILVYAYLPPPLWFLLGNRPSYHSSSYYSSSSTSFDFPHGDALPRVMARVINLDHRRDRWSSWKSL